MGTRSSPFALGERALALCGKEENLFCAFRFCIYFFSVHFIYIKLRLYQHMIYQCDIHDHKWNNQSIVNKIKKTYGWIGHRKIHKHGKQDQTADNGQLGQQHIVLIL
jgi:hypothetical protein